MDKLPLPKHSESVKANTIDLGGGGMNGQIKELRWKKPHHHHYRHDHPNIYIMILNIQHPFHHLYSSSIVILFLFS